VSKVVTLLISFYPVFFGGVIRNPIFIVGKL